MVFNVDPTLYLLIAAGLIAVSGVPGIVLRDQTLGQRCAALLVVVAAFIGELAVISFLRGVPGTTWQLDWPLPFGSALLSIDPLTSIFLLPLFLISACVAVYSLSYWPASEQASAGKLTLFLGIFAAAMVILVIARHSVLFLMAWEIMAVSAYFLLTTNQEDAEVQRVGTVYLLATHTGAAALFVMFSLLRSSSGSFIFPAAHSLSQTMPEATIILITGLIGFGGKAGLMPLHFWLPGAHANAPSHVSAMMSGLMLKMGVYGILRIAGFFDGLPEWLGWVVLFLGAWSAINGIALAAGQRDLKRLLACSSIENIGIIFIGIGLALVGQQMHAPYLVVCGLFGAFIHIINHGLFKSLLFLGSGVLIHATGTREIDRMGGLGRRMPITSPLFLLGSLAICGLPPLNGFVGELFLYIGAFTNGMVAPLPLAALIAPTLALVGGLAVITFVKLYGIIFLGAPRSDAAAGGHEAPRSMTGPMTLLATGCLVIGMAPLLLIQLITPVVSYYGGQATPEIAAVTSQVPLLPLTIINTLLVVCVVTIGIFYLKKVRTSPSAQAATWGCGYLAPTARMQYTGTSFSELAISFLGVFVGPDRRRPQFATAFAATGARFYYTVTETVLDRILMPIFKWSGFGFSYLRKVQHGQLHIYVLYIFATLCILMVWKY